MKKNKMHALKLNAKKRDGWLKIGTTGRWDGHVNGSFELDERDFKQMILNAEDRGLDIVVDYEHATIYSPDKAPAAGWIKIDPGTQVDLKVEEGNLYCRINWTQTAAKHIDDGEYKYLSPVFVANSYDQVSDRNIGWTLHSVALTNKPFLSELDPIANKQLTNTKEKNMPKPLQEQLDAANEQIKTLKAKIEEQSKVIAASEKAAAQAQVAEAITAGKLPESQKEWAENYALSDKEGFQKFMETLVVQHLAPDGNMFDNSDKQNSGDAACINMTQV